MQKKYDWKLISPVRQLIKIFPGVRSLSADGNSNLVTMGKRLASMIYGGIHDLKRPRQMGLDVSRSAVFSERIEALWNDSREARL